MWGIEEVILLSESLWLVMRKGQDWYGAKEKKKKKEKAVKW